MVGTAVRNSESILSEKRGAVHPDPDVVRKQRIKSTSPSTGSVLGDEREIPTGEGMSPMN